MNLYLLTQTAVDGYDTYSDAVVAAESEDAARRIHPDGRCGEPCYDSHLAISDDGDFMARDWYHETATSGKIYKKQDPLYATWAVNIRDVQVRLIGIAVAGTLPGVVCASFHAG